MKTSVNEELIKGVDMSVSVSSSVTGVCQCHLHGHILIYQNIGSVSIYSLYSCKDRFFSLFVNVF